MRATVDEIRGLLRKGGDQSIDLYSFQVTASRLVDRIATGDTDGTLGAADLREIEKYLTAHFYTFRDQQYEATSTDGASDRYQGKTAMYFESSFYGQTALMLDSTGYLAELQTQAKQGVNRIEVTWLGKPPSEQIPYESRD